MINLKILFMRKIAVFMIGLLAVSCGRDGGRGDVSPAIPVDNDIETKVKEIVSGLSLEDKVGQMCEVVVDLVCADSLDNGKIILDEARLDTVFNKYRVGSILNTARGEAQDRETWYRLINGIQEASMRYIGIPDVYGVDQNHGTTYTVGGTLFPQEINMAASFNRDLVKEGAAICAYESRASSIPWVYNPVMDLGRNPVWSRIWESFGEDPYLNGEMAVEMVKGYQGDDPNHIGVNNVGACLKHYMAYGNPVSGKDRTPTSINPVDLREKYFQPFKMAIRAGALSVMVNSGVNNGLPFHANHEMLTVWLKEDLNWDGMIVTDWADIHNLWKRDKIAADYKEAIMLAINAGIDMSMTPYDVEFCRLLKELVDEGKVKMERIDDAVSRIIRFKLRLGLYEHPATNPADYPLFGSKQHAMKALELAVQSEILLKNDNNVLPIPQGKRILVTGPNANSMRALNGGWSYTWQGTDDARFHESYNTIYEALREEYGAANVVLEQGMDYVQDYGKWEEEQNVRIERAVAAAGNVDVIVACVGENSYTETPGNTNDLHLSANQVKLVKAPAATGKPVVLVLNEGRPRIIREIEPLVAGVVDVMLPGNYGGDALALLLSGKRNFSARLPFTYPKWINSLATYDHKPCETVETMSGAYNYNADIDVQWPFGFGLSYTTFEYSGLSVDKAEFSAADTLTISVDVTNKGDREGMEPVLCYSSDLVASITPDVLRLRAFDKISLKPGEKKRVEFKIPASDLAFVGYDGRWILEKGEFEFTVANLKVKAACSETKQWTSPNIL
ncbi:MAG: glycoside hydrolase family 3 C-terminal domain-containing protein [Muribaculaceae bacterium]|nr:glycoside hydrolase family 3 C-terminal domain-containing protein [Muribaculaceae bacterium]